MLRARLATAAVAIPTLLVLIWSGPLWGFQLLVSAIAIGALLEYSTMAFPNRPGERFLTVGLGAAVAITGCFATPQAMIAFLTLATVVGMTAALLTRADFEDGLRDLGLMMLGILYLGVLAPHFAQLEAVNADGRALVLLVIAVGMAGDTTGYFAGRSLGKHKLMPRVSPGKTVEGAIGIMVGSVLGGAIAKLLWLNHWSWSRMVSMALVMGILGQLGDLTESLIKRTFGTKESGWIFPGHGGILDRIDSLLFPVVFVYYHAVLAG